MAEGWICPQCRIVLAPSVSQHRCEPPSAGVTTVVSGPQPTLPTVTATPPWVVTTAPAPDTWTGVSTVTVTSGHLGVVSDRELREQMTGVFPSRLEIAGGTAA